MPCKLDTNSRLFGCYIIELPLENGQTTKIACKSWFHILLFFKELSVLSCVHTTID